MDSIFRLGEIVKNYKEENDLSDREFGRRAGISYTHVKSIMDGASREGKPLQPNIGTLRGIAKAMNLTLLGLLLRAGYVQESDVERYITKQQLEKILPPEYHYLLTENKLEYLKLAEKMEMENIAPEYLMELLEIVTKYDKK